MDDCLHCGERDTLDAEGLCPDCAHDAVEAAETAAYLRSVRDEMAQQEQPLAELGVTRCDHCGKQEIRAKGLCAACYQSKWATGGVRSPRSIRLEKERLEARGRTDGPKESRVRLGDGTLDPGPETVTRSDY